MNEMLLDDSLPQPSATHLPHQHTQSPMEDHPSLVFPRVAPDLMVLDKLQTSPIDQFYLEVLFICALEQDIQDY